MQIFYKKFLPTTISVAKCNSTDAKWKQILNPYGGAPLPRTIFEACELNGHHILPVLPSESPIVITPCKQIYPHHKPFRRYEPYINSRKSVATLLYKVQVITAFTLSKNFANNFINRTIIEEHWNRIMSLKKSLKTFRKKKLSCKEGEALTH